MASNKYFKHSKENDEVAKAFSILLNLFGTKLPAAIIKSVGISCHWDLSSSINILTTLTEEIGLVPGASGGPHVGPHGGLPGRPNAGPHGGPHAGPYGGPHGGLYVGPPGGPHGGLPGGPYGGLPGGPNVGPPGGPQKGHQPLRFQKKPQGRSSSVDNSQRQGNSASPKDDADVVVEQDANIFGQKESFNSAVKKKIVNAQKKNPPPKQVQNKSKRELEFERICDDICTGAKVLVLLRGVPGSGKTYLAKQIVKETIKNESPSRFVFSTDEYFERNGAYNYNPTLLQDAHFWNQSRVQSVMRLGISPIIIDNTNTEMWEMKPYVSFAVAYGYAVEILEPNTPWIFNAPELERRTVHNVPIHKIRLMLNKYMKNINPPDLFSVFKLKYDPNNQPPQPRQYPSQKQNVRRPTSKIPPLMTRPPFNIPSSIARHSPNDPPRPSTPQKRGKSPFRPIPQLVTQPNTVKTQPKPKKKRTKNKKSPASSVSGKLSKSASMNSILTNDDDDDSDSICSDIDTLQELPKDDNKFSLNISNGPKNKPKSNKQDSSKLSSSTENFDLINFNDVAGAEKNNLLVDLSGLNYENKLSQVKQNTTDIINACVKMYKEMKSSNPNIKIENNSPNIASSASNSPDRSNLPKPNLSSWGLTEESLISWDLIDISKATVSPKQLDPQPQRTLARQLSTLTIANNTPKVSTDTSTITSSEDFFLYGNDIINLGVQIKHGKNRTIAENMPNCLPKKGMFDKGTMTGVECALNSAQTRPRCDQEEKHFSELVNLFPSVGNDVLKDIFEKCQGDVNWAVDILLDGNAEINLDNKLFDQQDKCNAEKHVHTVECNCVANYNSEEVYLSAPSSPAGKPDNSSADALTEEKKKLAKSKNKVSEETLLLKKQLEEQFIIDSAHYSPHVSELRRKRHGDPEPLKESAPENVEVLAEASISAMEEDVSSESDEEILEMNVGMNFVEQLEHHFGNSLLDYPIGFQPVLQLPASLVRQLHIYWVESVYQQMDAQQIILDDMLREDEEFARKLQEAEAVEEIPSLEVPNLQEIIDMEIALLIYKADVDQWKRETPDDLASRMKRQKLVELYPNYSPSVLEEMLQAFGNSLDKTVEILNASISEIEQGGDVSAFKRKELIEVAKREYIQVKQVEVPKQELVRRTQIHSEDVDCSSASVAKSATDYREEAAHHLQMRNLRFSQAHGAIQKRQYEVANYYNEIAQMHKQKYEIANGLAASAFLNSHAQRVNSKTLDLHFLYVKEAESALAVFLDEQITKLRLRNKPQDDVYIITGRGKNSKRGISHIKPAIKRKLMERRLDFVQENPGFLKVVVFKDSVLTNDMRG